MSTLKKEISKTVTVGIYDNCEQFARIYDDKIIATIPQVKWEGNTGGYHEFKFRMQGSIVAKVQSYLDDDCEDQAWDLIETEAYFLR